MQGIIMNLVEEAVLDEHGEAAWDQILQRAGLDGAYTSLGTYPDEELFALVTAGAELLGTDPDDLTRHLGRAATLGLAERYPQYFRHDSARDFLLTLNDVIHPEVRKLHRDADPPEFWYETVTEPALVVHYVSRRRLCVLAMGMIEGAATHYGERAVVEQVACMKQGAPDCTFQVTIEKG